MINDEFAFVGRDAELEQLGAIVGGGGDVTDRVAVITGDLGLGKTRLIQEAVAPLDGVHILTIRGESYGAAIRTARSATRSATSSGSRATTTRGDGGAARCSHRRDRAGPDPLRAAARERRARHRRHHLRGRGPRSPVSAGPAGRRARRAARSAAIPIGCVIVVDDAHWIDDSSAHLLERLADATVDRAWAMLVARSTGAAGFVPTAATVIALQPLTTGAVMQIIRDAHRRRAAASARCLRNRRAGRGSPLFLGELLRTVGGTGTTAGLPETLESLVGTQIDALPPLARRLLRYAAVLGRSFGTEIVDRVLENEGIALDAASRTRSRISSSPPARTACSSVTRWSVTSRTKASRTASAEPCTCAPERQWKPSRAGKPDEVADLLSLHYSLGQQHSRAWHYARVAGDGALQNYANVEAATHYERALEAGRRLPDVEDGERAEVLTRLGDARERAGMFTLSLDAYKRASRLVRGDDVRTADLLLKRARARTRPVRSRSPCASSRLPPSSCVTPTPRTHAVARARVNAFSAMVRWGQEQSADAAPAAAEAAIAEARAVGAREALAAGADGRRHRRVRASGAGVGTRLREALAHLRRARGSPPSGSSPGELGFLAATGGRWDEAVDWFSTSRAVFDRSGDTVGTALGDLNLGEILINQRREADAELALENAASVLRSVGFSDGAAYAELQLARVWCELDRLADAEELLAKVGSEFTDLGQHASVLEAALVRGGRARDDVAMRRAHSSCSSGPSGRPVSKRTSSSPVSHAYAPRRSPCCIGSTRQRTSSVAASAPRSQRGAAARRSVALGAPGRDPAAHRTARPIRLRVERAEEILSGLGVRHRDRTG